MLSSAKLVLRNARRQPRRTILAVLTLAGASFVYALLVSIPASIDGIVKEHSATLRVLVYNRTARWSGVPARYCGRIRQMPGVVACVGVISWPASYRDPTDRIGAIATDSDVGQAFPDYRFPAAAGEAFAADRRGALVGTGLMKKYGWKLGQRVTLVGDAGYLKLPLDIVGEIPAETYPNILLFRRDYLTQARKAIGKPENDRVRLLVVRADRTSRIPQLIAEIDRTFHNSDFETRTITEGGAIAATISSVGDLRVIVYSLSVIVMVTVLLIVSNSAAMMVRDRLKECALLRSLGFTRLHVAILMDAECALLGTIGGLAGAGLALYLFDGGSSLGAVLGGEAGRLAVSLKTALEALGVAIAVGTLSAILPTIGALRAAPAIALRQPI
jgi:putative ABC transport system permease protein